MRIFSRFTLSRSSTSRFALSRFTLIVSSFALIVLSAPGTAFAQDTNFATGPQYLMNSGSPMFAQSISTPSLTLASPPLEAGASNATGALSAGASDRDVPLPNPDALPKIDLFPIYYGQPSVSVIEISFSESQTPSASLPQSILDTGVSRIVTAEGLRARGYGVTLAEAAAYGKAHRVHATQVYTNADLVRLHGSGN